MDKNIPISFFITVYNEEERIRYILDHAVRWANDVIIINKSSTDNTKEICLSYNEKVKIFDVPFSLPGHEDALEILKYPKNNWIYVSTASEIPTRKLIEKIREKLNETNGELDLIYIPRRMFSMGLNSDYSPWNLCYYPFLINYKKVIISDTVHNNFQPTDPGNTAKIEYSEDCCVYHFTHTTAKNYLYYMTSYFEREAKFCKDPDKKIKECFENIARYEEKLRKGGPDLLGQYCSWPIYWLGTALFIWEKYRAIDVAEFYENIKKEIIERDWQKDINETNDNNKNKVVHDKLPESKWRFNGKVRLGQSMEPKISVNVRIFRFIRNSKIYLSSKLVRFILKLFKKILFIK